ncbi:Protein of unknown function [Oscillibacter sp. PC13]|uniref:DUF2812 domain-containing protein n=1 Tax=Oscillibacter sp. PC13 TaxID=1855299 RepID=UPI0008F1AD66|nr:DUF2812 domain-containing protein [Oscillibacter sp. PC13]SFP43037.1 Protein of unknown function [Oscillibacter sp. PC13]
MTEQQTPEKVLPPVSAYDVAAVETWLEDEERKGYRAVGISGGRVLRQREEHRESRYRLQPISEKKEPLDPEREALYRDLGWEHVGVLNGVFRVWRCTDPAAPELDTDPVVQAEGYRYLKRRMLWQTAGYLLVLLALAAATLRMVADMTLLEALRETRWSEWVVRPLLGSAFWVLLLVELWLDVRNMRRLWKTLTAGIPLERPRPYRRQLWLAWISYGTAVAILVLQLVYTFPGTAGYTSSSFPQHTKEAMDWEKDRPRPEVVTVELSALDGIPENMVNWFSADRKSLPPAPEMYWTRQYADLPDGEQVFAEMAYYRLRTPALADRLEEELLEEFDGWRSWEPLAFAEAAGLDSLWWTRERGAEGDTYCTQYLVAAQGNALLTLYYHGAADLRDAGEYLAGILART